MTSVPTTIVKPQAVPASIKSARQGSDENKKELNELFRNYLKIEYLMTVLGEPKWTQENSSESLYISSKTWAAVFTYIGKELNFPASIQLEEDSTTYYVYHKELAKIIHALSLTDVAKQTREGRAAYFKDGCFSEATMKIMAGKIDMQNVISL